MIIRCPKCRQETGDDWSQCHGSCPMEGSPHYKPPAMPRIWNIRTHGRPEGAIYIGRGSKWGNKFRIGVDGGRNEVIAKYYAWLQQQPRLMAALPELRGKDLLCWCSPFRCHGDVLRELSNAPEGRR